MSNLSGAIMELRTLQRRIELTGIGTMRLPDILTALHFLEVAAEVDGARCLRAVTKGMTEWKTNGAVKMQMYGLFAALKALPKKEEDDAENKTNGEW